jgi:FkbM family methyltransferase
MRPSRILKLLLLLLPIGLIIYFYAPFRLAALALTGRSPVCPFKEAVKSADNLDREIKIKDRILHASRLLEKDPAGYHLWDTPQGRYWIPKGDDYVLAFNLAEQERRIYGTGARSVQPGDIVLDCGANVGVFTRVALDAGAKQVVAIEFAPDNLECLRRNFAEEIKDGRVIIYPKGVWDKDDTLTLTVSDDNTAADTVVLAPPGSHEGPKVALTTIDKLVGELKLPRVDFIKMDIEGAERNALAGARATLVAYHPRMALCTYHRLDDPKVIPLAVRSAWSGYRMECGPCAEANWGVRPDVVYFY